MLVAQSVHLSMYLIYRFTNYHQLNHWKDLLLKIKPLNVVPPCMFSDMHTKPTIM